MRGRRLRRLVHVVDARSSPADSAEPSNGSRSDGDSVRGMTTFGYQIPGFRHAGAPDAEMFDHTLAHALAAEESGFASVWVMDHFWQLPALGGPTNRSSRRTRCSARSRRAPSACSSARSSPA